MTQEQKNFLQMSGDVQTHFESHRPTWTSIVPISESIQAMADAHREVQLSALVQTDGSSGSKEAKDLALQLSADKAYTMGRRVLAWAKKRNKPEVALVVDLNRTELTQGAEQDLLDRHRLILKTANDNKAELADYKVSEEALSDLETAINTFAALRSGKKEKENHRIYSTGRIEELVGKLRDILDVLDDEVEGLIDNKEFIETYFIARRKTDRRATRSKAKENGQMQGA